VRGSDRENKGPGVLCRGQGVSELTLKKALGMLALRVHAFNATNTLIQSPYRCALGCGLPIKKPANHCWLRVFRIFGLFLGKVFNQGI